MEQVEQMRAMEKNLISLAREIEKLRADVMNAEKGERGKSFSLFFKKKNKLQTANCLMWYTVLGLSLSKLPYFMQQ